MSWVSVIISDGWVVTLPPSAGTPTFLTLTLYHPWGDDPQSISGLLLKYLPERVGTLKVMHTLAVVVPHAVQLVLTLPNLLEETVDLVHCPMKPCHFCKKRLVTDVLECVINFVTPDVLALEVAPLLMSVVRQVAMVKIWGCVDFT